MWLVTNLAAGPTLLKPDLNYFARRSRTEVSTSYRLELDSSVGIVEGALARLSPSGKIWRGAQSLLPRCGFGSEALHGSGSGRSVVGATGAGLQVGRLIRGWAAAGDDIMQSGAVP